MSQVVFVDSEGKSHRKGNRMSGREGLGISGRNPTARFKIRRSRFILVLLFYCLGASVSTRDSSLPFAQQPQAQQGQPLMDQNVKFVNGVAPGYWPTAGTGLAMNLSAGSSICGNLPVSYAGGKSSGWRSAAVRVLGVLPRLLIPRAQPPSPGAVSGERTTQECGGRRALPRNLLLREQPSCAGVVGPLAGPSGHAEPVTAEHNGLLNNKKAGQRQEFTNVRPAADG